MTRPGRPSAAWRSEAGSVTAWMTVVPVLLLILGGISLDLWAATAARGRIAAIADDAAVAGATALDDAGLRAGEQAVVLDPIEAERRALTAVDVHPDVAAVVRRSAVATPDRVAVTVEGVHELTLMRLVGAQPLAVRVTGVAAAGLCPSGSC